MSHAKQVLNSLNRLDTLKVLPGERDKNISRASEAYFLAEKAVALTVEMNLRLDTAKVAQLALLKDIKRYRVFLTKNLCSTTTDYILDLSYEYSNRKTAESEFLHQIQNGFPVPESLHDYLRKTYSLKDVLRWEGSPAWANIQNSGRIENDAIHTWSMTIDDIILSHEYPTQLNRGHCVLVDMKHDKPEFKNGDITTDKIATGIISEEQKKQEEIDAMHDLLLHVSPELSCFEWSLWSEYDTAKTDTSLNSKSVDKFNANRQFVNYADVAKIACRPDALDHFPYYGNKNFIRTPHLYSIISELIHQKRQKLERHGFWNGQYEIDWDKIMKDQEGLSR